ncbi:type VI secretion system baseplate subunit TssG [Azospirillum sp. 412522]|nr:type VI secretion system baseplate subunit TssG [Azospirillum sp. 412522]MBY6266060.1 type VI secretion system baseplate subunit TssG [Azospirillum sp. 412522]
MATPGRQSARPLIEALEAEPWGFDLFQAIALLERAAPDREPLGSGIDPDREAVRIEHDATLAFAASDVVSARQDEDGRGVVRSPVLGLGGAGGPLPYAATEMMLERVARRDTAGAAFYDIFNHRLMSILYRTRQGSLPLLERDPERSLLARALRSLVGIGTASLEERLPGAPDRMLLAFSGILSCRVRSAAGLETMIGAIFQVEARVKGFVGRWLPLGEEATTVVGAGRLGRNNRLGQDVVVGRRVWDQQTCYDIELKVDSLERYRDFLPSGRHHATLCALARFHSGEGMDFQISLVLNAPMVPHTRLSARDGSLLGWTSWLRFPNTPSRTPGRLTLQPATGATP